jgi:predicted HTH domain antitoxin
MTDLIISEATLQQIKLTPSELLIELATYLYDKERLTMGQAKKLAGLNQIAFQKELAKREIEIKYDFSDLEKDLENLKMLGNTVFY